MCKISNLTDNPFTKFSAEEELEILDLENEAEKSKLPDRRKQVKKLKKQHLQKKQNQQKRSLLKKQLL